jgi:6-methylsalicylate decarboxylase
MTQVNAGAEGISRRSVIGGAVAIAGAAALGPGSLRAAWAAENKDYVPTTRVDVHAHYFPAAYLDYINRRGGFTGVGLVPLTVWTVSQQLAIMDTWRINAGVLSIVPPGCSIGDLADRIATAQAMNDEGAARIQAYGERFGVMATLPLPDVPSAIDELRRALDTLHLDGVGLSSNFGSMYLGDPALRPLYQELDAHSAVCFVHPFNRPGVPPVEAPPDTPWHPANIDWPCSTMSTISSLIYNGIMRDYPNIRFIVAHAGGAIASLAFRLASLHAFGPSFNQLLPEGPHLYLRELYYDTAQAYSEGQMRGVLDIANASHIVYGSDAPPIANFYANGRSLLPLPPSQLPNPDTGDPAPTLSAVFDNETRQGIDANNALRLFPRLRSRMGL